MKVLNCLALFTLVTNLSMSDEILIEPLPPPTERSGELFLGPKKEAFLRFHDTSNTNIQVDLYETNKSLVLVFDENQTHALSVLRQLVTIDRTVRTKQTISVWISKSLSKPLNSSLIVD